MSKAINKHQIIKSHRSEISKMDSVSALYKELKIEWSKPSQNLRKCGSLIDQLKVNILNAKTYDKICQISKCISNFHNLKYSLH